MFKGLLPEQIMESIKDKNSSCTHTGQGSGEQLLKGLIGEQIMESIKEKKCSCTRIHTYKIQKSACREVEKKSL